MSAAFEQLKSVLEQQRDDELGDVELMIIGFSMRLALVDQKEAEILQLISQCGVHELNEFRNSKGYSMLGYFVFANKPRIVGALLYKGIEIEGLQSIQGNSGITPLMLASRHNHPDICNLLMNYGADPKRKSTRSQMIPLHIAVFWGHRETVAFFLTARDAALNKTPLSFSLLTCSIRQQHVAITLLLLEKGASLVEPDDMGMIPLQMLQNITEPHMKQAILEYCLEKLKGTAPPAKGLEQLARMHEEALVTLLLQPETTETPKARVARLKMAISTTHPQSQLSNFLHAGEKSMWPSWSFGANPTERVSKSVQRIEVAVLKLEKEIKSAVLKEKKALAAVDLPPIPRNSINSAPEDYEVVGLRLK